MKNYHSLTGSKEIRAQLVVTQQELADYLAVSLSQVAMYETGRLELSTKALLKLNVMVLAMQANTPALTKADLQKQAEAVKKALAGQEQQYQLLAQISARKLEDMRRRYLQCFKTLQVTAHLLAHLPAGKESKTDKICLELMRDKALKKLTACNEAAQAVLQLQTDVYTYHAEHARAMMG